MANEAGGGPAAAVVQPAQVGVWLLHLVLPLLGLWLLLARPAFDVRWEDHLWHFVLVVAAAGINVALGLRVAVIARRRSDARLLLLALVLLSSAGLLGVHALMTPTVIMPGPNAGFEVSTPLGLLAGAVFAVISSVEFTPERSRAILDRRRLLAGGLIGGLALFTVLALLEAPPLDAPPPADENAWPLQAGVAAGVVLYAVAAWRYWQIHRRRPAVLLVAVITTFALLAEAMVAVALGRNWHASWWLWHVLMLLGFALILYSANVGGRREGATAPLFHGIALAETIREIQEEHGAALEDLVAAMRRQAETGAVEDLGPLAWTVARRFGLSEGQREVLERAAAALAGEREQIDRLGALVEIGKRSQVIVSEQELLRGAVGRAAEAFPRSRLQLGLVHEGRVDFPAELAPAGAAAAPDAMVADALRTLGPVADTRDGTATLVLPLVVKDHAAGVLCVVHPGAELPGRDRAVLESLATQLSIALENARLYAQLDTMFRRYVSPDVVTTLLSDPEQAKLGGAIVEVTVLFADLRGFTSFSERTPPDQVVDLLNRYFGAAVPRILEHGGTVMKFVGDAVMAVFNAPARQADHPLRAARAALAMQDAIEEVAGDPDLPRFRVGVTTGPALVGNIGSEETRDYTVIGDAVNTAARLEGVAEPGQVVVGAPTAARLGDTADLRPLGQLTVKGKRETVEAFVLAGFHQPEM